MKPIKAAAITVCMLMFVLAGHAQYTKYSTVRIYPPKNKAKLSEMLSNLDVDHYYENGGGIMVEIGQYEIKKLRLSGFKYDIVVDDIKTNVEKQNRKFFADRAAGKVAVEETNNTINNIITTPSSFVVQGTFGGYYSFAQMNAAMDALVTAYPSIVSKTSLGLSIEGRNIWCIKISDNVATDDATEPDLLYMGLQHAREAITGASMIFFMQYLAEQYATNSKVASLVNNREIYIIPCFNPDGWEFNRLTAGGAVNAIGGGQRKNRRNIGTDNAGSDNYASSHKGVDLNRNWGVDWGNCSAPILGPAASCGLDGTPASELSQGTYYGTAAFSEPETQAVRTLVTAAGKNFVVGFDQHAFGPYYSLPYGRRSLHGAIPAADSEYLYNTSALMGQYNGMRANDSYGALGYEVAGGFKDWMLLGDIGTGSKGKVYGITGEGGAGGGSGGINSSFWAPASEIINLCKGMCYQNLQLAYSAGSYIDIQDVSDIALTSLTGNLSFSIRRIGLVDAPVTVSIIPLQNMSSAGSPVVVTSLPNYNDMFTGNISYTLPGALANGQRLRFAWKVETAGNIYYDTVVKFYNPTQLLYDDMEGTLTTNWTNITESGAILTSGFGYNYTAGDWVFTTSGGYGGSTKALSESAAGTNYTTQSIRIVQYNSTFNLTGTTAAYLSFWTRHRAENFRDKLRVEVSTDGTTWVPIAGSTTIKEPGTLDAATINGLPSLTGIRGNWTREIFDLSAYNGTAALRLRFNFTSDNDASTFQGELDDGFYIDNLKVIRTTTPLITLGANFLSFNGKLLKDNTVELNWDAVVDQKHRYFEVEKSSDRQNFISIGRIEGTDPYKLIDMNPFAGNNYYRIKEVDADGKEMYSTIINIIYNPSLLSVSLYPNPVIDELNFKIKINRSEKVTVQVSDLSGRIINIIQVNVNNIEREYQINTAKLSPQVYVLKVINSKNEVLTVQKFMKQ
jgi:carboxypeptidase T